MFWNHDLSLFFMDKILPRATCTVHQILPNFKPLKNIHSLMQLVAHVAKPSAYLEDMIAQAKSQVCRNTQCLPAGLSMPLKT